MPSEAAAPAALTPADLEGALALSDAAGWNQTADDWAFFLRAGGAIGERDAETGRLVGTTATLRHGRYGWVSMVLVAADRQHRGVAGRLVAAATASLQRQGAVPVLDATPAGRPVYAAAGFVDGFGFERWERAGAAPGATVGPGADAASDLADLAELARSDTAASGLTRPDWFADVARRSGTTAVRDGAGGFALVRAGRRASQVGPVVAADEASAVVLVDRALAQLDGARIFIDVPVDRTALADHLARSGFVRQRPFTRMALGAAPPPLGARQFAFAGPEFG